MSRRWFACIGLFSAILAPVSVGASEWWYVNSGPGRVVFVDAKSIERRKDIVTYWSMYVIRPGDPEVMTKSHMRADCGRHRLGFLGTIRYDDKGQTIGPTGMRPGPMQAVAPDTLGDAEMRFACGDEGHRVANDLFALGVDEVAFAEALIARGNKPDDAHSLHDAMVGPKVPVAVPLVPVPEPRDVGPVEAVAATVSSASAATPDPDIGSLDRSCGAGDLDACAKLGSRLADGDGVEQDAARAALLFDKACRGGDADSCTLLGMAYHKGVGVAQNAGYAAAFFALACEKGGAARCGNIGLAYALGDGIEKDPRRAAGYFAEACDTGNVASCSSLGTAYSLGVGVKADQRRARALFERACSDDDAHACYNLGVILDQGLGIRKDPTRAVTLYEGACDRGEGSACGNLGLLVQSGTGVAIDARRAADLFDKACDLDNAEACLNLGRVYQAGSGVARDLARAAILYRRALAIDPETAGAQRALTALAPH
jgi:TPR repeat protein